MQVVAAVAQGIHLLVAQAEQVAQVVVEQEADQEAAQQAQLTQAVVVAALVEV
jgi:hypothetical protein